ncbi:Ladderlectin Precursor [Triplophysa tibetana]|uniref:Ladderlectin n=1 Tax=Triplophysa tibetana TaxID=1572043 RepID=A0A5A9NR02_9TELE|nr:Ladderlectin Precursor [Triplophysa tibetana]
MAVMRGLVLLFLVFSVENAVGARFRKQAEDCSFGWKLFGVKCFKFFPQTVDWVVAETNCQSLDANLASVRSKAQNDFLLSLLPANTRVWIGGHDGEMENQWLWSDGTRFIYTNWCNSQPDNFRASEHCLEISFTDNRCWNDESCSTKLAYICARTP